MAYTPTEWQTGDIVTAEKLNKLESGVQNAGSDVLWVRITDTERGDGVIADKTWNEIFTTVMQGKSIVFSTAPQDRTPENDTGEDYIYFYMLSGFDYSVSNTPYYGVSLKKIDDNSTLVLSATSKNDYPAWYVD